MEEAERLCDRLAIMDEGKIIAMGTLESLLAGSGCSEVISISGLPASADLTKLQNAAEVCRMERTDEVVHVYVRSATAVLTALQQAIGRYAERVSLEIAPLSLERFFLQLTGKELRD
jgi:ABC-type multidrug transport system ATPase subunit